MNRNGGTKVKIIYNDTQDAKIASVVLYQKFVLNFGIDMKDDDFWIANNSNAVSNIEFNRGEYVCIIGIPLDQILYDKIENLISLKQCKVLYICNKVIRDPLSLSNLHSLKKNIDNGGLSLKIVYDTNNSLSLLSWIVSRYKVDKDITEFFLDKPYTITDNYEYILFKNEAPNINISIPWLIRFITDDVCYGENQIPETSDFHYGIDIMMDLPSNHVNWERLLSEDTEVMQLMTSGIPIRQYVERNRKRLFAAAEVHVIEFNWLQRLVKRIFKI